MSQRPPGGSRAAESQAVIARVRRMSPEDIDAELMAIREVRKKRARNSLQERLGKVFRYHRETTTSLSQENFADHIGMHRTQYSFVERGRRDFRLSTLVRLAAALKKPLWVILKEAEELKAD